MDRLESFFLSRYFKAPKRNLLRFSFVFMVLGIVLSVGILSAGLNLFEGYERSLKSLLLDSISHISIQDASGGYLSEEQTDVALKALKTRPEVLSAIPTIHYSLMAQHGERIRASSLKGYNFAAEFPYVKYIIEGKTNIDDEEVIIGYYLAKELGIALGDSISLIYPQLDRITPMGVYTGSMHYRVAGIYRSGYYESDRSMVITTIESAESLLMLKDRFSRIELHLIDPDTAADFSSIYQNLLGMEYVALPWSLYAQGLLQLVSMEKWLIFIVFMFIVLIAGINVISTVSTIILDQSDEIAVLKTLGANQRTIKRLFGYRVGLVAVFAVLIGQGFGALLSWLVEVQSFYKLKGDVYFIDTLAASITLGNQLAVFSVSTLLIAVCIAIPLNQIDRLQIIDLIRRNV